VEEWTIRNTSGEQHPFHVHTNDFQVMSTNGRQNRALSPQDTVNLPVRGEVTVRMKFTDFTGKTVFHCHILNHEDMGMMAVLEIVN
jgi:FtsP/CotA-like multicopper oxidase with cupredoxin domain